MHLSRRFTGKHRSRLAPENAVICNSLQKTERTKGSLACTTEELGRMANSTELPTSQLTVNYSRIRHSRRPASSGQLHSHTTRFQKFAPSGHSSILCEARRHGGLLDKYPFTKVRTRRRTSREAQIPRWNSRREKTCQPWRPMVRSTSDIASKSVCTRGSTCCTRLH